MKKLKLKVLPNKFSVCKLRANYDYPKWAEIDIFYSITKTEDELSVVTLENNVRVCPEREDGWRIIKILGPLEFGMVGVVSKISSTLAVNRISIFVISTFDTDYFLVKDENMAKALKLLKYDYKIVE